MIMGSAIALILCHKNMYLQVFMQVISLLIDQKKNKQ